MAHCTHYDISNNTPEIFQAIVDKSGYWYFSNINWIRYKEDCLHVSKLFPDTLIEIRGEGEDAGDLWVHYFKNGKSQKCKAKIIFDDFDEDKLV